jgi:PPK2 family polyphosphate:nucleotide phosphotransferase
MMSSHPIVHEARPVQPGTKVRLKDISPDYAGPLTKEEGEAKLNVLRHELEDYQEIMYAAGQHSLLVIFQGMDTSGKDGAIRGVFGDVNPAGCRVESFKVPTEEERGHDFLWRVHKVTPRRGMTAVFNRSHYEDVLVVRVHDLVPQKVWKKRYDTINQFEAMLADANTIILKFFLHISKDEQEKRLLAREQDVEKAWKLAAADWREREYWDDYQKAYEDVLNRCSTEAAPWYIVPANRKWYRNLVIAETIVNTVRGYKKDWEKTLQVMSQERLAELHAFKAQQQARQQEGTVK